MLIQAWVLVFGLASVSTGLTITKRLPAVIGALAAVAMFVTVGLGALNLEVVTSSGSIVSRTNQPLAYLALGGVVVNFVFLFADATGQIPDGGPTSGEELQR
jgi:cytochrome c-type biogenesis protein CcmE